MILRQIKRNLKRIACGPTTELQGRNAMCFWKLHCWMEKVEILSCLGLGKAAVYWLQKECHDE